MKAYLITTSSIFAAIAVAHVLRVVYEGPQLATDPWFILLTAMAGALCAWGLRLFFVASRRESTS